MHTHLEQWAADTAAPGEQLGVRSLAQGSHLSRGQFLPEPRFEPTTSGYKSDALFIRATTAPSSNCGSHVARLLSKRRMICLVSPLTTVGTQSVPEEVLLTVLLEMEAILNWKPRGYVSSDVADIDPVTPNSLLMALPQVIYTESELLSRRPWRFIRNYLPG